VAKDNVCPPENIPHGPVSVRHPGLKQTQKKDHYYGYSLGELGIIARGRTEGLFLNPFREWVMENKTDFSQRRKK
jgi:hypothetical protein